jgi:hypothetical protein
MCESGNVYPKISIRRPEIKHLFFHDLMALRGTVNDLFGSGLSIFGFSEEEKKGSPQP